MTLSAWTLTDVLEEQRSLDRLCADRPLRTREVFPANAYYGSDRVLKEYAGMDPRRSLKVVVPHGLYLDDDFLWDAERSVPLPAVYAYPPSRVIAYRRSTSKVVVPGASPFLYLCDLLRGHPAPVRRGTLFFPCHSTHRVTVEMNYCQLAEALRRFPADLQPVTVMIYWKDYLLGRHRPFLEAGLPVVSAGHMYDPHFLVRLYHLLSQHAFAASNEIGSHLFYAVRQGCSFFLVQGFDYTRVGDAGALGSDVAQLPGKRDQLLRSMFSAPAAPSERCVALVDEFLGADYMKNAGDLNRELEWFERLDHSGFLVSGADSGKRFVVPSLYRRIPRVLVRRAREIFRPFSPQEG